MKTKNKLNLQKIELPVIFLKEGNKIIAYTPALDISTCGETLEKAKQRFEELANIFLKELSKMGTLKDVLEECGWEKIEKPTEKWIPPQIISQTTETFNVPWHVLPQ